MAAYQIETAVDLEPAAAVLRKIDHVSAGDIIPLLQQLQDAYGYLPREVMLEVAARTGLPVSRIYGVATFYAQFHFTPHGRHTIRCCRGTACHVKGGKKVAETVESLLGVTAGHTTQDRRFTFETVACLGTCFLAPVMMVDSNYYGRLTPTKIKSILDSYV